MHNFWPCLSVKYSNSKFLASKIFSKAFMGTAYDFSRLPGWASLGLPGPCFASFLSSFFAPFRFSCSQNEDIRGHTSARFATYPLLRSPKQTLAFPRLLLWNKLHGAGQGRRVPAVAPRVGQGKTKAAKEENPEELRVNLGLHVPRRVESHQCSWPTLRTHQRQLCV